MMRQRPKATAPESLLHIPQKNVLRYVFPQCRSVLPVAQFELLSGGGETAQGSSAALSQSFMALDGAALQNLEVKSDQAS